MIAGISYKPLSDQVRTGLDYICVDKKSQKGTIYLPNTPLHVRKDHHQQLNIFVAGFQFDLTSTK